MMNKLILSILSLLAVHSARAQFVERVYLKDSTYYQGWIIEQIPQENIKILREAEGDTLTVETGSIWKIVRILDKKKSFQITREPVVSPSSKLGLYLEAGGNSVIYAINLDRRFNPARRDGFGYRLGAGYIPWRVSDPGGGKLSLNFLFIPATINYVYGKRKHSLEGSLGMTFINLSLHISSVSTPIGEFTKDNIWLPAAGVYYKFTGNKGLLGRAGVTALYHEKIRLLPGISIGYNFH